MNEKKLCSLKPVSHPTITRMSAKLKWNIVNGEEKYEILSRSRRYTKKV